MNRAKMDPKSILTVIIVIKDHGIYIFVIKLDKLKAWYTRDKFIISN